jgi:ParB family chromosome partitioning protein
MKIDRAKIKVPSEEKIKEMDKNNHSRSSVYTEEFTGEYYNIQVEKLIPFKNQARKYFDQESIDGLAKTIEEHGIRQPLTIVPSELKEGYFEVVSGERRLRAAKSIGLKVVPCIIIHDKLKAEEIAIIENIQRKDLNPIELGYAYKNLIEMNICESTQKVADKLGIHKSAVVEALALTELDEDTQTSLIQKQIKNRALLRALCNSSVEERNGLIQDYLSVKQDKNIKIKTLKKRSLKIKSQILSVALDSSGFVVDKNRLSDLDNESKEIMKKLLLNLFD